MITSKANLCSKTFRKLTLLLFIGTFFFSCKNDKKENNDIDQNTQQVSVDTSFVQNEVKAFTGKINSIKSTNAKISGEVAVRIEGELARFNISAEGLAPDMRHMQYLLVSRAGNATQCPQDVEKMEIGDTNAQNRQNNQTSGTDQDLIRIPLQTGPITAGVEDMDLYPRTNENGDFEYTQTVHLDSLGSSVDSQFSLQNLDFKNVTFVLRGIPDSESNQLAQNRGASGQSQGIDNITVACARFQETPVNN